MQKDYRSYIYQIKKKHFLFKKNQLIKATKINFKSLISYHRYRFINHKKTIKDLFMSTCL